MSYDVITIGSATLDVFLMSDAFKVVQSSKFAGGKGECFSFGSKIEIDGYQMDTGGGATNTAATFSRLGLRAACITEIGDDLAGEEILGALKKEKISNKFVMMDSKHQTGYSTILLTSNGQRTILVYRGASDKISESWVPFNQIKAKWLYITSLGGDIKLLRRLVNHAKRKKTKIAFNPGSKEIASGKLASLLPLVDVLIVNKEEAAKLSKFKSTGIKVITDGRRGATVWADGKKRHIGIYPVKMVDATGAGDAFGSGFVAGLIKYKNLHKAMQLAAWNASSNVQEIGAKSGLVRGFPRKPLKVVGF